MKPFERTRPTSQQWAAYLEAEVSEIEAHALQAELARSEQARIHLSQLRRIRELLASFDSKLDRIDLTDSLRTLIQHPPPRARPRWCFWSAWATAVACFAIAIPTLDSQRCGSDHEFAAKSATPGRADAALTVYRTPLGEPPEPLGFEVRPDDGLLFSYTNPEAFEYLMVFAEDAAAATRWYHPAFVDADSDPSSISISRQTTPELLPTVIEQDLAPGPLAIYALFSHEPLRVSTIEHWLSIRRSGVKAATPAGAVLARLDFEVKR